MRRLLYDNPPNQALPSAIGASAIRTLDKRQNTASLVRQPVTRVRIAVSKTRRKAPCTRA
jgi:hypothetical protein